MNSERGVALVLVILSLLVVSGLTVAMMTSGRTEVLISRNQERAAQSRAAAEAGLNHGTSLAVNYIRSWQANGFANASAAMTRLLRGPDDAVGSPATDADNGSVEALGIPRPPTRVTLSNTTGTAYEARVMDEDDPARGLSAADRTRIGEDANAARDANVRLVVRATGYAGGGTRATLEATIGPIILPAIVTNGHLEISGNPTIGGANGSVHANGNLTISGSPSISDDATASGTYSTSGSPTVGGQSGGGRPNLAVPAVRAIDHRPVADFILTSGGQMTTQGGAVICNASANNEACKNMGYGWKYEPLGGPQGGPQWNIDSNTAPNANATFYLEADAKISGSPGSPASPLAISIIAEGNIDISGNPDLRPDLPELMFVTDKDLKISGNLGQPIAFEGQILVREQLYLGGNPTLAGQILVENVPSVSNLVLTNTISGNPTIVYNGLVGSNTYDVSGWREIR